MAVADEESYLQFTAADRLFAAGASGHDVPIGVALLYSANAFLYALVALVRNALVIALIESLLAAAGALHRLSLSLLRLAGSVFVLVSFAQHPCFICDLVH